MHLSSFVGRSDGRSVTDDPCRRRARGVYSNRARQRYIISIYILLLILRAEYSVHRRRLEIVVISLLLSTPGQKKKIHAPQRKFSLVIRHYCQNKESLNVAARRGQEKPLFINTNIYIHSVRMEPLQPLLSFFPQAAAFCKVHKVQKASKVEVHMFVHTA